MKKIHIAVACHKKSNLPVNPILVPVQVGAAGAKQRMNMAQDDEGINISLKNSSYCELTAQYWEWKNIEADYYGLCHYRRFLCFKHPEKVVRNDRDHIIAEVLDEVNIKRFGLNDESSMRRVIEENDAIVGEYEQIKKLYTPRGKQSTAYKHWTACDRALIHIADLERMLAILDELDPQIGADTREYLELDVFTGFNCFVLRKDLFDQLCSLEFKVLEQLEQEVDLSRYSTQCSRIFGFMGEIISSAFLYHLEKSGKYRVKHVPILFFNYTDDTQIQPLAEKEAVNVLFFCDSRVELFSVLWYSFLCNISAARVYHAVICLGNANEINKEMLLEMANAKDNISIQIIDSVPIQNQIRERYFSSSKESVPVLPMLPYYLQGFQEMLVITNNTLINDSLDELWDHPLPSGKVIAAPLDALMLAKVNDIFPETEYTYLKEQMRDPYQYHSIHCMKINLKAYRDQYTPEQVTKFYYNPHKGLRNADEILNVAFEDLFETVHQRWGTWYDSSWYLTKQLPYMPKNTYLEMMQARKNAAVIAYSEKNPWELSLNALTKVYWENARQTPYYDFLLAYRSRFQALTVNEDENCRHHYDLTERLFPKGSVQYKAVLKLMPKESSTFGKIKKTLAKFNLE